MAWMDVAYPGTTSNVDRTLIGFYGTLTVFCLGAALLTD